MHSHRSSSLLLSHNDAPPVIHYQQEFSSPFLIICDHAHNHVPQKLNLLDLHPSCLLEHIAYDLYIKTFSVELASLLQCPLIMAGYSRLVIETNRPIGDPTSMRSIADTVIIPRNIHIPKKEQHQRINEIFVPYHTAIQQALSKLLSNASQNPILIAMHSFTPALRKYPSRPKRPWHLGILSTKDRRLTNPFLSWIATHHPELCTGDNLPYSGNDPFFYSINQHALPKKLYHITFEIRQDILPHSPMGQKTIKTLYHGLQHVANYAIKTF